MSRTVRNRPIWTKYYNFKLLMNEPIDPRSSFYNQRDGKSQSLLYEGHLKCGGWNRDFVSGPKTRAWYKKIARRYRRREKIDGEFE